MRRFLHFVTALTLIFLLFGTIPYDAVMADSEAVSESTRTETGFPAEMYAVQYLNVLGAVDFDENSLDTEITRQEFAKIACIIGGYIPGGASGEFFSDVEPDSEYAPYINSLAAAGIVSASGQFEPLRTISVNEAAAMLVRILGYSYRANSKGGYPAGYIQTANALDLFENVNPTAPVTRAAAAVLCVNALNTEVMNPVSYGDSPRFETEDGYILSYRTFGIVHVTDIVDAVDLTSLKGENDLKPYHISIGGLKADVGDLDPWSYLGYETDAYLLRDARSGDYTLKYICKTARNEETAISVRDIVSIEGGIIKYYSGDKLLKCRFNTMASVVYNGASTSKPLDMSMIEGLDGEVRVLDNGASGSGSVVFLDVYTDCVVADVDPYDEKVYDRYDKSRQLVINTAVDDPYTIIYNSAGEEAYLGDISSDSVLSVYKSMDDADQKYIRIYLSNEKIAGEIEQISSSSGAVKITVEGREFELTENCRKICEPKLKAGITVELLLNSRGYVSGINFEGTGMMFGYLKGVSLEKDLARELKLRIFTENGNFETFTARDKLEVDGTLYQSDDSTVTAILEEASNTLYPNHRTDLEEHCYAQPIRYSLTGDGEVNCIDTIFKSHSPNIKATSADIEGNNALYDWYTMTAGERGSDYGLRFRSGINCFGGRFMIDDTTKFLAFPSPEDTSVEYTNEEKYSAVPKSYFVGTVYYFVHSYSCTENNLKSDYLLVEASQGTVISTEEYMAVVKSVTTAQYKEETVSKINVLGKNGGAVIMCKNNFTFKRVANSTSDNPDAAEAAKLPLELTAKDLQIGDVIRYVLTPSGYADNIELYYRIKDGYIVNNTSYASNELRYIAANSFQIRYGYAVKKFDNAFAIKRTDGFSKPGDLDSLASVPDSELEIVPKYSSCSFIIYDSSARDDDDRIKSATYAEIIGYKDAGAECSKIIIQSAGCTPSVIVIVK